VKRIFCIVIICCFFPLGFSYSATTELTEINKSTCYDVFRYLYRWYLTESDIKKCLKEKNIDVYINKINKKLDDNDKSLFLEIYIPTIDTLVSMKKADYFIPEQNIEVKNKDYRISSIVKISNEHVDFLSYYKMTFKTDDLISFLTKTRLDTTFPEKSTLLKISEKIKKQISIIKKEKKGLANSTENIVYIAPISVVKNELWVYWLDAKILIHCAADMDMEHEHIWANEKMYFEFYDVYNNTVLSLSESPNSNTLLSVQQVSRIIYNCLVLGKQMHIGNF